MTEHVQASQDGAVAIIRLARPDKKNALTRAMYGALSAALRSGDADSQVRVHVLLGVPGAFSSGNDIADFMAESGGTGEEVWSFLFALAQAGKPLISGVDGIAVGIGATIHFHCDLTFATPRTMFRTPFVDLGLVPEAGSSLLGPALLGPQRAFAMLALGEGLSAEAARAAGLVHEVVAEDQLEAAVLATAARLAAKPPEALRITRDLIRGPREPLLARIRLESDRFRERLASDEAQAAFAAFMARTRK